MKKMEFGIRGSGFGRERGAGFGKGRSLRSLRSLSPDGHFAVWTVSDGTRSDAAIRELR